MTKEDIIKLAREAGGLPDPMVFIGAYERFAALVAAAEREACAKVCDEIKGVKLQGYEFADAIRARGQA